MIGTSRSVRVFAYCRPVDMRKGFEGLSAPVRQELGRDPLSGDLYLFVRGRRTQSGVEWRHRAGTHARSQVAGKAFPPRRD